MVASAHRPSTSSQPGLPLAGEFEEPTYQQWQRQVEKILRDAGRLADDETAPGAVEDLLATTTYDGITLHPLYTGSDQQPGYPGLSPFVRGSRAHGSVTGGWDVRQPYPHPDAATANERILADLNGGATSAWLRLGAGALAIDDLADALDDVHLDMIGVVLDAGEQAPAAAEALWDVARERGVAPSALRGNLGLDPLSVRARTGRTPGGTVDLALRCNREYTGMYALVVDGSTYHDAGGSDAEELGCSLAAATTYLRWLTEAGLDVDTACGLLEFRYAATCDQFGTIAKLRAARRLWARITRECGASESARAQAQHAATSSTMLTRRDPWVNILRTTIATFAAGVGGARAITVRPFDSPIGLPDAFAHRVARNTSALLLEESRLAQVIDPAGGSWYVESLTGELARGAWSWFQRIEEAGGLPAALDSGLVHERLADTWQRRRNEIAHRRDPIIGVSEYPNLHEPPLRRDPYPQASPEQVSADVLPAVRYAEDFERLRDAADQRLAESGSRPTVFLATLGPLATYTARASFARNLFAAGGIDSTEAGVTESTRDVLEAYSAVDTPVVCLCSSDAVYAERAEETARALRQAGAARVLLAGKPTRATESIDEAVFDGCDAVETLHDVHGAFGIDGALGIHGELGARK